MFREVKRNEIIFILNKVSFLVFSHAFFFLNLGLMNDQRPHVALVNSLDKFLTGP